MQNKKIFWTYGFYMFIFFCIMNINIKSVHFMNGSQYDGLKITASFNFTTNEIIYHITL